MLIRNARLVALTDAVPGLVDVRVTDGVVAELGAGLSAGAGETSYDADGGWLMPGLWDQHVHLGPVDTLSAPARPRRVRGRARMPSRRCVSGWRSGRTCR